jgi:Right handed beta helix region
VSESRSRLPAVLVLIVLAAVGCFAWWGISATMAGGKQPGGQTYYVSPGGHDSAAGTSPATSWRSLARASAAELRPGDRLLLAGGSRFTGQLRLGPQDAGDPGRPVYVGSYGNGRATIAGDGESGLVVVDAGGIDIGNLVVSGHNAMRPDTGGIVLYSTRTAGPLLDHVTISGVDVSGFGTGISIYPEHKVGFANVSVTDSVLHDNLDAGLASSGPRLDPEAPGYANANIRLSRVVSYANRGNPANASHNSGSGIVLASVKGATIAWSTAHDNGGSGGAAHEGPAGIWAYDATGVVIEHNLAYHNTSASWSDGGGFDLDQGTSDSCLQYNLSYGNHGAGYLLYGGAGGAQQGNVVRFNISSGDALSTDPNTGSVIVAGEVRDAAIYQNTVVTAARNTGPQQAALVLWHELRSVSVRNNIFLTEHSGLVVRALSPLQASAVVLQGNDYRSAAGLWRIDWGGTSYSSLAAWQQATGQEHLDGRATGTTADPGLAGPVLGLDARTSAAAKAAAAGFQLTARSPLRGAGLDLGRLFGTQPGPMTYAGQPVRPSAPDVGAL